MRTTVICFLDKGFPPDHSFITGMLANTLPKCRARVQLIVGAPTTRPLAPERYHRAVVVAQLPTIPRKGKSKFTGVFKAYLIGRYLISRARRRGDRIVLLVRNDPLLLQVAALLRRRTDCLIFQNSFPLEATHSHPFKRWLHRTAYKTGCRRADAVLTVSPLGLERVRKIIGRNIKGTYIPLLADLPTLDTKNDCAIKNPLEPVRFIYVGTHSYKRCLEIVLQGAVKALDQGASAIFIFVGGSKSDIERLRTVPRVRLWEDRKKILLVERLPRPEIMEWLNIADVGLSLVPPNAINREMSPTKLAEYMGAGLAVLASRGVDLQDQFMTQAKCGLLIPFDADAVAEGVIRMTSDRGRLSQWQNNARLYACDRLRYERYTPDFLRLMS